MKDKLSIVHRRMTGVSLGSVLFVAFVIALPSGCRDGGDTSNNVNKPPKRAKIDHANNSSRKSEETGSIQGEVAIRIAKEQLDSEGHLPPEGSIRVGASNENGVWTVSISRFPAMPGGHTLVMVSDGGKVLAVVHGE